MASFLRHRACVPSQLSPFLFPSFRPLPQVVVTPGFNVQEYINIEKIQRPGVPMVVVNGNLDRIRGGEGREGGREEGKKDARLKEREDKSCGLVVCRSSSKYAAN